MTDLKLVPRFQRFLKNAVFSFLAVLLLTSAAPGAEGRESAKYIFLFIGDGMGEAQVRAAELYSLGSGAGKISFSSMPVRGKMSTSTADGAVTDSAAAGTAIASGYKTKNGILNMDPSGTKRFLTVAMLARDRGMKVGIVTSSFLNDATPAAFYAWRPSRTDWYEIGEQLAESGFDYFAGGGVTRRRGRKGNLRDVYGLAREKGYRVLGTREELAAAKPGAPIIAPGSAGALPYDMDRPKGNLSLAEYTGHGIRLLDNPKGFFLMVEGGTIDWACHRNDAAALVHDMAAFDAAVKEALAFAGRRPKETLIVVLADHETGGMSIDGTASAAQVYAVLSNQKKSSEVFDRKIEEYRRGKDRSFEKMLPVIAGSFGLHSLSEEELDNLRAAFAQSMKPKGQRKRDRDYLRRYGPYEPLSVTATRILGRKAGITWSSFGHSGADVPVFAQGAGSASFAGKYDNTEVGRILIHLLPSR
jgi:alkaline phosphatase